MKENLMELVRDRLVECGWKDEIKLACRFFFILLNLKFIFVLIQIQSFESW